MKLKLSNITKAPLSQQLTKTLQRKPSIFILSSILSFSIAATGYLAFGFALFSPLVFTTAILGSICASLLALEYKRALPINIFKRESYPKTLKEGPIKIGDRVVAFLAYIKDLPILYLQTKDAKKSGQALVKAFNNEILDAFDQYYDYLPTVAQFLHFGTKHFERDMIKALRRMRAELQVKIPQHYISQFEGIVEEANKLIEKDNQKWIVQREPITVDTIIDLLTFPDLFKFGACTSGTTWDPKNHTSSLFRNLDWPSFGVIDIFSMLLASPIIQTNPKTPHDSKLPQATFSVTFQPGVAGLTMANDKGLAVVLNEATNMDSVRHNKGGIPELLIIREIARNCSTIDEVKDFLQVHQPLASHILTIQERSGASVKLQMLPPSNEEVLFEVVTPNEDYHNVAANHFICPESLQARDRTMSWPDSKDRSRKAQHALKKDSGSPGAMKESCSVFTTHSVIFKHKYESFEAKINRDCYSAAHSKVPTVKVDINEVLEKTRRFR